MTISLNVAITASGTVFDPIQFNTYGFITKKEELETATLLGFDKNAMITNKLKIDNHAVLVKTNNIMITKKVNNSEKLGKEE